MSSKWPFMIYIDNDAADFNGTYLTQKSYRNNSASLNLGGLASGSYYIYIRRYISNGVYEYSNYVPIVINAVPQVNVIEPSTNIQDEQFKIIYSTQDQDNSSVSVNLKIDKDKIPGNGNERTLVSTVNSLGQRAYTWDPGLEFNNNYYVYAQASDGLNSNYSYSSGQLLAYLDPAKPISFLAPGGVSEFAEPMDYAAAQFSDPWDMNNADDIGHRVIRFSNVSMKNGIWSGKTVSDDSYFWFLWGGYPGAYSTFRDGERNPIDTNVYKKLTFKMYTSDASAQDKGTFYWFNRKDLKEAKFALYRVQPGWHIYSIDLGWAGQRPLSLRLDPTDRPNTVVMIDWIKLSDAPSQSVDLQWNDTVKGEPRLFVDSDSSGHDGASLTNIESSRRTNSQSVDVSGFDWGNYYFYARKASGFSGYSAGGFRVNKAPVVKIIEPDEAGGRDWARTYLGNAWDMNQRSDVILKHNLGGVKFGRGVFSAVNARGGRGGRLNDPYFLLNLRDKRINTGRYHRLTVKYKYAGTFSLVRGTMARVGWTTRPLNHQKYWQMSDDILTYDGWNTITIDLKRIKLNRGRYGWRDFVTRLRFDPHEDPYRRRFFIDSVALREDDKLSKAFAIKYRVDNDDPTTALSFYRDKDRTFGNGNESLIAQRRVSSGVGAYRWRPSRRVKGAYWIYIKASDNLSTRGYYSTGPLRVH